MTTADHLKSLLQVPPRCTFFYAWQKTSAVAEQRIAVMQAEAVRPHRLDPSRNRLPTDPVTSPRSTKLPTSPLLLSRHAVS